MAWVHLSTRTPLLCHVFDELVRPLFLSGHAFGRALSILEQDFQCALRVAQEAPRDQVVLGFDIGDFPDSFCVQKVDPSVRVGHDDWGVRRDDELAPGLAVPVEETQELQFLLFR